VWDGLLEADPWNRLKKAAFEWLKCWYFRRKDAPFENLPKDVALIIAEMTCSGRINLKKVTIQKDVYSYYFDGFYISIKTPHGGFSAEGGTEFGEKAICHICLRPVEYGLALRNLEAKICPVHGVIAEVDKWGQEKISKKCTRCKKKISRPLEEQFFCEECFPHFGKLEQRREWLKVIGDKFEIEGLL